MNIKNLFKSFGTKAVLKGVDLDVLPGEIVCVMGASGSGKTTLLNAVSGLIDYDGEITSVSPSYVFQTDRLVPGITVYDNLALVMPKGVTKQEKTEKIKQMLALAGLDDILGMYPAELSGGMAQRVAFVRAFLYDTDVMLMDEPFRSLDVSTKAVMAEMFFNLHSNSPRSVLFVTHDVDEALHFGDRIAILKGGKITKVIDNRTPREKRKFYLADAKVRKALFCEFAKAAE